MRKLYTFLAALALTAFVAAPASAGIGAVSGTLAVAIGTLGGPALTGSGSGSSGGFTGIATLPASVLFASATQSVAITPPALGLSLITVPATGGMPVVNFAGTAPGTLGNNGIANLFFTNGAPAGSVPLTYIGGGGSGMALVAGIPVTIVGATWTKLGANTVTPTVVTTIMQVAAAIPVTITATAFDNRDATGNGTVQFVAPASAKLFGGNLGTLPVVGVLTLVYSGVVATPEPGTLLLLGAGIAGLVAVGRKRAQK